MSQLEQVREVVRAALEATDSPECRKVLSEALEALSHSRERVVRKAQEAVEHLDGEIQVSDDAEVERVNFGYWVEARVFVPGWMMRG